MSIVYSRNTYGGLKKMKQQKEKIKKQIKKEKNATRMKMLLMTGR